jgi:hypothetical protein
MESAILVKTPEPVYAFSRRQETRLACSVTRGSSVADRRLVIFEITDGHLRSLQVDLSVLDLSRAVTCSGIDTTVDGYIAVVADDLVRASVEVSGDGELRDVSNIPEGGVLASASARGMLLPRTANGFGYSLSSGSRSFYFTLAPPSSWTRRLSRNSPRLVAVDRGLDTLITDRGTGGVVVLSSTGWFDEIDSAHSGFLLHDRGEDRFGWVSVGPSGGLHYSIGNPDKAWVTESTEIVDADSLSSASNFANGGLFGIDADVESHPATGEPLIVYANTTGELQFALRESDATWVTWRHRIAADFEPLRDIKVRWVGCGRPAVEYSPLLSSGGWYVLEAK